MRAGLDGPEFDRHLDAVWERISVTDRCSDLNGPHSLMKQGADRLGWSFKAITRNIDEVRYSPDSAGLIGFGDRTGAKQSTARTYLADAREHGAEVIARCFAEHFPDGYAFGIVNIANPDMVGHTGVLPAVIAAVEASDAALGVILGAVAQAGGIALVTADHGNAEQMLEPDGSPHTAHTTNPVPLVVTLAGAHLGAGGRLGDLAPTVLGLLGVPAPLAMTGRDLLAQ